MEQNDVFILILQVFNMSVFFLYMVNEHYNYFEFTSL